jgi:pimeloyl-ACP methyl ester carboxylesterase
VGCLYWHGAFYAKPPSEFTLVAGIQLYLRDTGEKNSPALVLLHGFGSSLHTWDAWASALEKDYLVIHIDLPKTWVQINL